MPDFLFFVIMFAAINIVGYLVTTEWYFTKSVQARHYMLYAMWRREKNLKVAKDPSGVVEKYFVLQRILIMTFMNFFFIAVLILTNR